jgi:hypothetical protein
VAQDWCWTRSFCLLNGTARKKLNFYFFGKLQRVWLELSKKSENINKKIIGQIKELTLIEQSNFFRKGTAVAF